MTSGHSPTNQSHIPARRNVLRRIRGVIRTVAGALGGFAQLTTVTRYAITTSIIHRWLDRGEPISR